MRDWVALRWFCVGIGEVAPTSGDGGSSQTTILKMSIVLGALGSDFCAYFQVGGGDGR